MRGKLRREGLFFLREELEPVEYVTEAAGDKTKQDPTKGYLKSVRTCTGARVNKNYWENNTFPK